MEKRISR